MELSMVIPLAKCPAEYQVTCQPLKIHQICSTCIQCSLCVAGHIANLNYVSTMWTKNPFGMAGCVLLLWSITAWRLILEASINNLYSSSIFALQYLDHSPNQLLLYIPRSSIVLRRKSPTSNEIFFRNILTLNMGNSHSPEMLMQLIFLEIYKSWFFQQFIFSSMLRALVLFLL